MKQYFIAAILMASFPVDVISAPIDSHVTAETREVYNVLRDVSRANRVLVGKHNPTLFGVYGGHPPYWTYDYNGRKQAWMFNVSSNDSHLNTPKRDCMLTVFIRILLHTYVCTVICVQAWTRVDAHIHIHMHKNTRMHIHRRLVACAGIEREVGEGGEGRGGIPRETDTDIQTEI